MFNEINTWRGCIFFTVLVSCGSTKPGDTSEGSSSQQVSATSGSDTIITSSSLPETAGEPASSTITSSTPTEGDSHLTEGQATVESGTSTDSTTSGDGIQSCETWNDMCPEGMKCNPYFDGPIVGTWNAQGCFPVVESPAAQGEICVFRDPADGTLDSCDKGLVCWGDRCMPLCNGAPSQFFCPATFACATVNHPDLVVCLAACDPRDQCAGEGNVCAYSFDMFQCIPQEGEKPDFSDCFTHAECKSGFCGPSAGASGCAQDFEYCCTTLCSTDKPNCLELGQECLPLVDLPQIAEYQNLGHCSL
jgi:hypothetical protein